MKIGFIILCRYNSSRLPGKILRTIHQKPILQYIVDSLSELVDKDAIVVATSEEATDNPIAEYCKANNINLFRGDLNNVSKRFLDCAKTYGWDYATRINGDNLFVDTRTIQDMLKIAQTNKYDFVSNVKNRTFPKGMSVEMVKTDYYQEQYQRFTEPDHFEHVTIFLYQNDNNQNYYYFYNTRCPEAAGLQFAIDTQEDFDLAEQIIRQLGRTFNFNLEDVLEVYQTLKKR